LQPAIETTFKGIPHGYCHAPILPNLAEPIADADEKMKVMLKNEYEKMWEI